MEQNNKCMGIEITEKIDTSRAEFICSLKPKDKEKLIYRIQGSSTKNAPGTFVNLYARNASEAKKIESLKTGNFIFVKGKVTGVFMRNIDIDLARIVK